MILVVLVYWYQVLVYWYHTTERAVPTDIIVHYHFRDSSPAFSAVFRVVLQVGSSVEERAVKCQLLMFKEKADYLIM